MKSIISATVILLWMGCFLNCSAEQYGMLDWSVETSCNCDDEPAQEGKKDAPCSLCDFIISGGTPTISPIVLDACDAEISSPPAWLIAANQAVIQLKLPPVAAARDSYFGDGAIAAPCELVARRSVPVRGPTMA